MTSPDQTYDGGIDEQDRDGTEAALAVAIAALLAGHAATAGWLGLVQANLTGIVTQYLQRAALDMAISAGLSGAEASTAASTAVDAVLGDVERHTAAWLKISADDHAERAREAAQAGTPVPKGAQAPGGPMTPGDAKTAGDLIATSLATYARERVREEIARKLGARYKRWTSRGDDRVRETHRQLAGQTKRLEKPFTVNGVDIMRPGDPEAPPGLTIQCFPEGTIVWSPSSVERSYRRWYEGPLIKIDLASGMQLTGTPNHPILTTTGWQALQDLHVGSQLFKTFDAERMRPGDPVVGDTPTEISQVHHALAQAGLTSRVGVRAVDFHGDGGGGGEVQVVSHDGILGDPGSRNGHKAFVGLSGAQGQRPGDGGTLGASLEPRGDRFVSAGFSLRSASDVGGFSVGQAVFEGGRSHAFEHGFRPGALGMSGPVYGVNDGAPGDTVCATEREDALPVKVPPDDLHLLFLGDLAVQDAGVLASSTDASIAEDFPDRCDADTEALSDADDTLAFQVTTDDVVGIEVQPGFAGHVYNLQTAAGWYIANSIPVSNCRCWCVYLVNPNPAA